MSQDLFEVIGENITVENKSLKLTPRTMAIPALGCNLGELDWNRTRSIMINILEEKFNWLEEIKLYSPYK